MTDSRESKTTIRRTHDRVYECIIGPVCVLSNQITQSGGIRIGTCACPYYTHGEWAILQELRSLRAEIANAKVES